DARRPEHRRAEGAHRLCRPPRDRADHPPEAPRGVPAFGVPPRARHDRLHRRSPFAQEAHRRRPPLHARRAVTPFERLAEREFFGVKLGLDNVRALTSAIDHPERACPRVIIAGTNGKGSVAAMVSRALHAAGRRVGLYTSPHLVHLTERFRIAERDVRQETLADVLAALFETEEALRAGGRLPGPCTYFELTTVAAFELFRREGVDAAVLEVGLGGRFDATNVAAAPLAGITSVGLDHVAQLGATVEAIAAEKSGVIQPHATVVSGVRHGRAREVIAQAAEASGARLVDAHADVQVE